VEPISVVVPAYNAGEYIDAALASIACQTLAPDEVVVVDDGSTDDTALIAERWAAHLPISVIQKQVNEGLGAARRTAIGQAKGELIALLDSDDVWFPDHLQVLYETFLANGGGIVTAANYRWWPGARTDQVPSNQRNRIPSADEQAHEILRRNFLFVCTLFHRSDYERAGGFSDRRKDEDWDLWIRMIRNGVRVATPSTVTVLYRQRPDSLSGDDGCLPADIELLESLDDLDPQEQKVVAGTLRRLEARRRLLEGYQLARSGKVAAARRQWARAAVMDRSLRRGRGQSGSQTLRALACIVAPNRAVSYRDRRPSP
jgi:cellulose synthase/poly-beta-1,6-N-acetylglucosamine synthase-like glycosyltransferase